MPKARKAKKYFEPKKKIESDVAAPVASAGTAPAAPRQTSTKIKSIAERYPYVKVELRNIAVLSGIILVILVVLALVLP